MRELKVTEPAQEDLESIWEYIVAQSSQASALKVLKTISSKFSLLRDHPKLGTRKDHLLLGLRGFSVKKYIIYYQPFDDRIEILRVVHSSRDIKSLFEQFFDSL